MEKTERVAVVATHALGLSDIGSWTALFDFTDLDDSGNALFGDVLAESVSNSYLRAEHHMVPAICADNQIVVETADAVLVAHRKNAQDVKRIVERPKASRRRESITQCGMVRPWGSYEGIEEGDLFQVKHIVVNPARN